MGLASPNRPLPTRNSTATMAGWFCPSHSPWACAQECKPFPKSLSLPLVPIINRSPLHTDQVLVRINHKLKRPRVLADPVLLSFFLSLTNWAELSLRKKCLKSRPQGSVFIEKGRPITAWPNRHDLVAEWVQLVPFPPFCHKLPPTAPFFLWADRSQAHNACPHTWIPCPSHNTLQTLLGHMSPSSTAW